MGTMLGIVDDDKDKPVGPLGGRQVSMVGDLLL